MNQRPTREQVERLRQQYPAGTRIILHSMDDPQAPPPGAKGTVFHVDGMGQICVKWDSGSTLSLIPARIPFLRKPRRKKRKSRKFSRSPLIAALCPRGRKI